MTRKTKRVNWEDMGCGVAPYRFVGSADTTTGANAEGLIRVPSDDGLEHWTKPGGSCAVCGTYITIFYNFESSDGIKFHVGCECAEQAALPYRVMSQVKREKNDRLKKQRWAREAKKEAELEKIVKDSDFSGLPHPNEYMAGQGKTLQDYVDWMLSHSGTSGKLKLLKQLKACL